MAGIAFPIGGIDDGVVRLRFRSDGDVPWLVATCRDPEIPRWTRVPDDYGREDALAFGETADRAAADGSGLHLMIAACGDGERLGSIGIAHVEPEEARCDLGYFLAREARGRGSAARAVRLLAGFAFSELGMERVAIHVEPDNVASRRVAERCGFQEEGLLRSYMVNKDRRCDVVSYSLLRGEQPQPR